MISHQARCAFCALEYHDVRSGVHEITKNVNSDVLALLIVVNIRHCNINSDDFIAGAILQH